MSCHVTRRYDNTLTCHHHHFDIGCANATSIHSAATKMTMTGAQDGTEMGTTMTGL